MISSRQINYTLYCEKIVWVIVRLYLEKHLQLRSFLWISRSCKPSSCVFGALVWKIWPVSDSIIFWDQSWRYLDYWIIFANSLRVELHSILAFHNVGESFIFYGLGKASSSKTYFPRPSVVNQLNTIDTNLALLGNSMFILVLLSGFSILMGRMHILGT